jgi:hypothetical protein
MHTKESIESISLRASIYTDPTDRVSNSVFAAVHNAVWHRVFYGMNNGVWVYIIANVNHSTIYPVVDRHVKSLCR